jgi:phosphoribosyl-dephospho-CoA transferase
MPYAAHDLLWVDAPGAFEPAGPRPGWLADGWLVRAPLVVRRAAAPPGRAPVGVRGLQRNERCAGLAQMGRVVHCVTPPMLARSLADRQAGLHAAARAWPCIGALLSLAPHLDALGLDWGPAGGAGFWLAAGLPVLRASSDLDLVVRAPARPDDAVLAALAALGASGACRLDIQVDTGKGGFALAEYVSGASRVLLKTASGPLLVADPWAEPRPVPAAA